MAEETTNKTEEQEAPKPAAESSTAGENIAKEATNKTEEQEAPKPAAAAKAKPPKAPALEDKPFQEFIEQDFNTALQKALEENGLTNVELSLVKQPLPITGASKEECWQVIGKWQNRQRQFNLYFLEENINAKKAFSCTTNGAKPSTLESFMIDERKATLDLLLSFLLTRLNGQKWLARN